MTVRANKPAFNVREKLKELERPVGIAGNQILKSDSAQDVRSYLGTGRKNLVINGAMMVNQRYGTSSATVTDDYVLDRFKFKENHGGSASINKDQFPMGDNHPDGHRYAMQVACASTDTSLSGTEHSVIMHMIEGYNCIGTGFGTGEAKNVTLSFWVKTNCQGTYSVALKNSSQNKCMVKEYTAGEYGFNWQKIVITFPGCTDGSWLYDENIGMKLEFALAAGTTYTTSDFGIWKSSNVFLSPNQVNFYQNTNNRFFITGIQLEIGDEATDFDHRSYGEELALCQRYCYVIRGDAPSVTSGAVSIGHGVWNGSSGAYVLAEHPVPMRTNPRLDYGNLAWYRVVAEAVAWKGLSALSVQGDASSTNATTLFANVGSNNSDSRGFATRMTTQSTSAKLILTAEL